MGPTYSRNASPFRVASIVTIFVTKQGDIIGSEQVLCDCGREGITGKTAERTTIGSVRRLLLGEVSRLGIWMIVHDAVARRV
jgi:hypothetical protein